MLSQTDPKARDIFENTIKKYISNDDEARRLIDYHYSSRTMVYGAEMGYCIPHFDEIKKGFEKLDKTQPYDNGFKVTDTTKIDIVDENERYIKIHLVKVFDGEEYIIKVQKIYNK